MQCIRDSFDSDPDPHDDLRHAVVSKQRKQEKPKRGTAVPEGIASGFKKASELLREVDTTGAVFDLKNKTSTDVEEGKLKPNTRAKKKDGVTAESKPKQTESKKEKDIPAVVVATTPLEIGTSSRDLTKYETANTTRIQNNEVTRKDDSSTIQFQPPPLLEPRLDRSHALRYDSSYGTCLIERKEGDLKSDEISKKKQPTEQANQTNTSKEHEISAFPHASSVVKAQAVKQGKTSDRTMNDNQADMANKANDPTNDDVSTVDSFKKAIQTYILVQDDTVMEIQPPSVLPIASRSFIPSLTRSVSEPSPRKLNSKRIASPLKRKQLTVTEKAIHEFRPEEPADNLSLHQFFTPAVISNSTQDTEMATANPKAKAKVRAARKAKHLEKKSALLPPSQALSTVHDQHLVFGTSSQLLMPSSSPADQETDKYAKRTPAVPFREDSFVDIDELLGPSLLGFKSTKSLWSAANQKEAASAANSTQLVLGAPVEINMAADPSPMGDSAVNDDESHILGELLGSQKRGREVEETNKLVEPTRHERAIPNLPRSLGEAATRQRPASKSPTKKKRRVKKVDTKPPKPEDGFKKVPTEDLRNEVKSYGHKPPRARAKMIEIILRCREEKAKGTTETNTLTELVSAPAPSAAVGTDASDMAVVDEGSNGTKVAKRFNETPNASPAKPKYVRSITIPEGVETNDMPPPSFQTPAKQYENVDDELKASLIASIHRAVVSQPATHSIANPSWKEKIALYDPIVLEELTAWLNTGGLDAVGVDDEVWPALVRDWCESKSICFIWAHDGWRKSRHG